MFTIFQVQLDENKKLERALSKLYGLNLNESLKICSHLNLNRNMTLKDLNKEQISLLTTFLKENYLLEDFLRNKKSSDIIKYIENGSLRGFRHRNGLPVRGQRTHTNGKTRKRGIN